jgi:protein-tyrosine phosphatase
MFFFGRNKSSAQTDLSWLNADMHSHLIPGIDDGSPDIETSLQLIKGFSALGYKKIITTPHILWEIYPNTPELILPGLEALREALAREAIDMEISAAAEYFIDEHFQDLLRNRQPLLKISGNMVLVEISMVTAPMDLQEVVFEMQMQDYQPVIAHPERYVYLSSKKEFFAKLKDAGCLFQLNMLALTGHYGPQVKELAEYLFKNDYYSFAGTDLHHKGHLEALQKMNPGVLRKLKEYEGWRNAEL